MIYIYILLWIHLCKFAIHHICSSQPTQCKEFTMHVLCMCYATLLQLDQLTYHCMYSVQCSMSHLRGTLYTCTLDYTVHCAVYLFVQCTMQYVPFTWYIVHLYTRLHCTLCSILICTVYNVVCPIYVGIVHQITLYIVLYTYLYSVQYTMHIVLFNNNYCILF